MKSRARSGWPRALILGAALAGCGDARPAKQTDRAPGPDATSLPAAPDSAGWSVADRTATSTSAAPVRLRDVRAAAQDGFDRVTLEFGDSLARPGYHVGWAERAPEECGSGRTVASSAGAWLVVRLEPASAHTEQGEPTVPHAPTALEGPRVLRRVLVTCDFEGVFGLALEAPAAAPFRVLELQRPSRLAVDVRVTR